jgi:hypothetical protein
MRAFLIAACAFGLVSAGCRDEPAPPASTESGGAAALAEQAASQAREAAQQALNPKGLAVYSGPVGTVRGVVKVSGDPAPRVPTMVQKLPPGTCAQAHELHEHLFREGPGRTLGDVLVTVTEYEGYLPARGEAVRVEAKGCAFGSRILAMTFGQRLDVFNLDNQAYMPRLLGTPSYALRVAMPGGSPIPVFAPKPGQYILTEQTREYMRSDLFVLSYPTFDVTAPDGQFEIAEVPVGKVKVTAYAPAFGKIAEQQVDITAGGSTTVSFELAFSEAEYQARMKQGAPAAPATAPSAAPAAEPGALAEPAAPAH